MLPAANIRTALNRMRQKMALLLLACEKGTATDVAYELGYSSLYHFSEQFFNTLHFRPSQWKEHIVQ